MLCLTLLHIVKSSLVERRADHVHLCFTSYVHMVEPRVNEAMGGSTKRDDLDSLWPFRKVCESAPVLVSYATGRGLLRPVRTPGFIVQQPNVLTAQPTPFIRADPSL